MRSGGAGPVLLAVALLAGALAGCMGSPSAPGALEPAAVERLNPWERGLAPTAATPELAPRRSAAERLADVAPPGAPQFAAFDAVMERFMATHEVPAAAVAVLRNGQLRYQQGYGHLDEAATSPTPPNAMFRIASLTKPMTAAVVTMLVEQGLLGWDDPVFCLPPQPAPDCRLPILPHPARPVADARVADLTVRHLVDHRTGWTRGPCTAPIFADTILEVAAAFGVPSPPPAWRLAQWFLGTPMEFDPGGDHGELDNYCNMGYVLLGLVAEAATGIALPALYQAYLFEPLEVAGDIEPGHTLFELRNPREPFYHCDGGTTRSIFDPSQEVCYADGGFDLDGALAAGGLVATAAAVGAAYEVFWNDGSVRGQPEGLWIGNGHGGELPGTATSAERYSDELGVVGDVQVVILFNRALEPEPWLTLDMETIDRFQNLHSHLLAAYAAAEGRVPV